MRPSWMHYKDTPGHGYFSVSAHMFGRIKSEHPELLTKTNFYRHDNSFEKDCEVNRIVLAFPEAFSAEQVSGAERWVLDCQPEIAAMYFGREIGLEESRLLRERKEFQENLDKYVSVAAVNIGNGMVGLCLVRGGRDPDTYHRSADEIKLKVPSSEYHNVPIVIEDPSAYEPWDGKTGWLS